MSSELPPFGWKRHECAARLVGFRLETFERRHVHEVNPGSFKRLAGVLAHLKFPDSAAPDLVVPTAHRGLARECKYATLPTLDVQVARRKRIKTDDHMPGREVRTEPAVGSRLDDSSHLGIRLEDRVHPGEAKNHFESGARDRLFGPLDAHRACQGILARRAVSLRFGFGRGCCARRLGRRCRLGLVIVPRSERLPGQQAAPQRGQENDRHRLQFADEHGFQYPPRQGRGRLAGLESQRHANCGINQ